MNLYRREKLAIAVIAAVGIFLFQIQTAFAGSEDQDGRNHLVDGGYYLEDSGPGKSNSAGGEVVFTDLDMPTGGMIPTASNALPDIRIMPLGDSITKGYPICFAPDTLLNCIGYREELWDSMIAAGYAVDFVGSLGSDYQYQYSYDNDHEGHGGKTAGWIKDRVYGPSDYFLPDNPADVVLLHIGTNDFSGTPPLSDPNDVVNEVSGILNKIDAYESGEGEEVWVILAKITRRIDSAEKEQKVIEFNQALQTMAEARILGGDNLILVDMESALIYPDDLDPDELHPNLSGYSKMAAVWYAALVDLINLPPSLTHPGVQSSIQGQNISLQMQATDPESDTLTYSATGLPTGLTINPNSGEISGKVSNSISSGTNFQVTITTDDKNGFPYTNPYNKDQVTFSWKIGEMVVLPVVIQN